MGTGRLRAALVAAAVLAPVLAMAGSAAAAPGDLDPGFGNGGVVVGPEASTAPALARQADGKLVVGGMLLILGTPNVNFRLARFNANGTLDTSFGVGGVVDTDRTPIDRLWSLAIQADGKIVAAGSMFVNNADFAVARYDTNGTLDATFGTGGVAITNMADAATGADQARAVAIQADGKIVTGGNVDGATGGTDFALARYNTNGTLDTTFGGDGKVTTDLAGGNGEGVFDLAILGDGKIVAAGCSGANASNICDRFALARYATDGNLDNSFSADGKVVGPVGAPRQGGGGALAVQADGKLVLAGYTGGSGGVPRTVALARFHADGSSVDTSFDNDGVVSGPVGDASDVTLQTDGRIVVAGQRLGDFLVARYSAVGAPDPTFGDGGVVTTDVGPNNNGGANGVVVQPDARLVVAGLSESKFTLARYEVSGGGEIADVSVTVSDAPDPVVSGGNLTYSLTVANAGPQAAFRVVATAVLPAGSAFVSATPSRGLCAEASGTVTCSLNSFVPGASATVGIVVNPGPAGTASFTASVTTSSSDSSPGNNSVTTSTTVLPGAGAWVSLPGLGGPRSAPATVLGDGRVLLAGGVASGALATAEIYDPVTRTSTPTGPLGTARVGHTLTALADGRVVVAGGVDAGNTLLPSAEIWNPGTGQWTPAGNMGVAHARHTAVRLDNGKLLVVGGMDLLPGDVCPGPTGVPNSAELFDPAANGGAGAWSSTGNLQVPRLHHTTTKLSDGRVLAVGGYIPPGYQDACGTAALQQNAPVELYNPATGSWSQPVDTAIRRNKHSATLLGDGSVLVVGGNNCNGTCPTTSVESYDPATSTWSARASLPLARTSHAAIRLDNGKVLVAAGEGTPGPTGVAPYPRSATLYDPATDSWAPAGLMSAGRVGPAVALSFNRVLMVGGEASPDPLASVELWTPRPTVTAVSPTSGGPGTTVTLTGTGLASVDRAAFGTAATAAVTHDPANLDTKLTVVSPGTLNTAGGTVDVVVSGPGGPSAASAAARFSHPAFGYVRATTNPAVPAQITIDGVAADTWGTNWVATAVGAHTVCFARDIEGFTTPGCQSVNVTAGATTSVVGTYAPRGFLQVGTSPCCLSDAVISLKGPGESAQVPRDNDNVYTDVAPGTWRVCWGPVAGLAPPPCQDVTVTAGQLTTVIGAYTASAGAPGPPASDGLLRVTTSPAVPAQITVDGIARDTWSLKWLRMAPGAHTVCFARDIEGFTTPSCQSVNVASGQTTTVVGTYVPRGFLQVGTDPCCQAGATIAVNGTVRDNTTVYTDLPPATYQVCWGTLAGRVAPACQAVAVSAGALSTVIGTYESG